MQEKEKTNANNTSGGQPMTAGKPVREAPLRKRNALKAPMIGATRKVAVVKKYPAGLVWARAGDSRSPRGFCDGTDNQETPNNHNQSDH